jgi:xanthine dehydrogenase YagR molybdenum-binding subunit
MANDINRRDVLQGAAAFGTLGHQTPAAAEEPRTMQMQTNPPVTRNIGAPASRVDGRAKVTGAAKYAAEYKAPGLAHGSVVTSRIARGRIVHIDTGEALRVAGVIDVLTHVNRPAMAHSDAAYKDDTAPDEGSPFRPLYDGRIRFNGQPIALVVAEEPEIARFAASLLRVQYDTEAPSTDIRSARGNAVPLTPGDGPFNPPKPRGDTRRALADAVVRVAAEYSVPIEHHNPMEPYATTAVPGADGRLTVYEKTQGVQNVQRYLASVFGLKPDEVRVVSRFMGGGFGSGLRPNHQAALAVMAARALGRPVRVVLTRQQMYGLGYRPAMIQEIALGANEEGTLDAIAHYAVTVTSQYEDFHRGETGWSGLLYACPNAKYAHSLARLDLATSCDMRAPSAATGVYALECAMDELADALELDPLELRLKIYSDRDQNDGKPYSSKALRECYREGAQAFGWNRRHATPHEMRDGNDLIGYGMATGVWDAMQVPISVRIALTTDGRSQVAAEVSCASTDIGTGTYTIMTQVAADMLGLPPDRITIRLGDSALPQSPVEGGSWIAASVSNGIATTAGAVRDELLRLAQGLPGSPLKDATPGDVVLAGGQLMSRRDPSRVMSIADMMRTGGVDRIVQEKHTRFARNGRYAHNTHSAVFAEVRVDAQLGVIRVARVVSAIAAGRILNPKTARSQIIGGVVGGIGMALHEETLIDHSFGRIMNHDFAEYHVPANADVPDIDVIFVDEPDRTINPLGVKGVGEIGIVGVAAAVANAVYNATGKRVRDLPITMDKVVGA